MRRITATAAIGLWFIGGFLTAQEPRRAAPLGTPPQVERPAARAFPRGSPENRWRYRYTGGRWWYWTSENNWAFYDGTRWRPLSNPRGYVPRPVDPALLRLEYREGVLGRQKWPSRTAWGNQGGAGSLSLSGTQGALGGAPSGSYTDPVGVPSGINSSIGTSTDVSGLNAAGRPVTRTPLEGNGFGGGGFRGR